MTWGTVHPTLLVSALLCISPTALDILCPCQSLPQYMPSCISLISYVTILHSPSVVRSPVSSCLSSLRSFVCRISLALGGVHRSLIIARRHLHLAFFLFGPGPRNSCILVLSSATSPPSSSHRFDTSFYTRTQCNIYHTLQVILIYDVPLCFHSILIHGSFLYSISFRSDVGVHDLRWVGTCLGGVELYCV